MDLIVCISWFVLHRQELQALLDPHWVYDPSQVCCLLFVVVCVVFARFCLVIRVIRVIRAIRVITAVTVIRTLRVIRFLCVRDFE